MLIALPEHPPLPGPSIHLVNSVPLERSAIHGWLAVPEP